MEESNNSMNNEIVKRGSEKGSKSNFNQISNLNELDEVLNEESHQIEENKNEVTNKVVSERVDLIQVASKKFEKGNYPNECHNEMVANEEHVDEDGDEDDNGLCFGAPLNFEANGKKSNEDKDEVVNCIDEFIDFAGEQDNSEQENIEKDEVVSVGDKIELNDQENIVVVENENGELDPDLKNLKNFKENILIESLKMENEESVANDQEPDNNIDKEADEDYNIEEILNRALHNNIKFMYDQNTDKARKRNLQMKMNKQKAENIDSALVEKKEVKPIRPDENEDDHSGLCYTNVKQRPTIFSSKNYAEKSEKETMLSSIDSIRKRSESGKSNSQEQTNQEQEHEINVSFMEENIEADESELKIINRPTTSSTFVPLNNQLINKNNILRNEGNFTDSYLKALGLGPPISTSSDINISETETSKNLTNKESSNELNIQEFTNANHSDKKYVLNTIEETKSECTESEIELINVIRPIQSISSISQNKENKERKLDHVHIHSLDLSNTSLIEKDNSEREANADQTLYFTFKKQFSTQIDSGKVIREKINNLGHKMSKRDIVNAKVEIVKIIENIQKKFHGNQKNCCKTLSQKKKRILKEFLKIRCNNNIYSQLN